MADHACRDCRELISAFVDGEATGEENTRLRQHLATCPDCRAVLDSYRQIGGSIRALPAVHAPRHLTEAIFSQTIDAEPRRLFLITSRLGYSLAAVASVLLIFVVAAYLIVGGYERGLDPTVDSSEPERSNIPNMIVNWPQQEPVEIKFNKEMNRESVIAALGMQPPLEKSRLSLTWDGNTLVIGGNPPFKPKTNYEIKISTDATDKWGNHLKEPFQLAFTTSESLTTVQTPTPGIVATATAESVHPTQTAHSTASAVHGTPTPAANLPSVPTATPSDNPAPGSGNGTPIIPVDPTATPTVLRPIPTQAPIEPTRQPESTATPTPQATATLIPEPPTPTPPPTATATATATTPALPTATETPGAVPVVGAIGDVYWSDQTVQERLGAPVAGETSFVTEQLDFQRGVMLFDEAQTNIYVLKFGSGWDKYPLPDGEVPASEEVEPGAGIYTPAYAFGTLWATEPAVSDQIGFALTQYAISFTATAQQFEHGVMLATPTTVYVIYEDFTWDWFTRNTGS